MRIGVNPEKNKYEQIEYKPHRVIIPVYIPNTNEKYFTNSFLILKKSLESLLKTVNKNYTNITIINNNCKIEVTNFIDNLLENKQIDKHVKLTCNYGKVYTILSEAKASFEDLITIVDADVFFFSGWLENTFKIFNNFKRVGVVAPLPMPQLAFYANKSLFFSEFFKIKKSKIISDKDLKLFEKSVNSKIILKKNNWFNNQLYLTNKKTKVCIGAGHFVATYRKDVLENIKLEKPKYVFEDGAEKMHLDIPIDKLGYYRLSTLKTYVYHMGNTFPEFLEDYKFTEEQSAVDIKNFKLRNYFVPFFIRKIVAKIYRKIVKI